MKSITNKIVTLRKATAQAVLKVPSSYIEKLKNNDLPKKDVLIVAKIAGIQAAKKCPELIPYCHSLPLDVVSIDYEVGTDSIAIIASCEAIWKTGVEMEALAAASVTALTIYDMLKPLGTEMSIEEVKLLQKKGGKTQYTDRPSKNFKAAILVTSDGTHEGKRQDKSGKIIQEYLREKELSPEYVVLPDETEQIKDQLLKWCEQGVDLVITTGGTGLSKRDVTVEATQAIMEREIPGIMEAARNYGQQRTPYAMLSRGVAVQRGQTLIVNLPGSSKGVEESLTAIFPYLWHAYGMMIGGGHAGKS